MDVYNVTPTQLYCPNCGYNVGSRCSGFLAGEGLYLRRNQSERKEARKFSGLKR